MNFLDFILPPALGAFIGYLTNAIAIKMLFKPYKEWRIFGFRVPFTPGIIPKNRDELAHNIGKMVGDILLNEETLQKQLVSEHSHKVIDTIIHDNLDRLLNYDCPTLYKLIPTDIRDMFLSYYSTAKEKIKLLIDNFFMGNPLNELVKNIVSLQIEKISEKKLSDLLSQSDIKAFISIIFNNLFNNLVKKDFVKDWLNKSLDQLKTVNV
ncbi:MAG: DUF445 family protein, partial [Spirochaetota bacterium]|nr:DUF445 family protein [Spirochaetota bacterium]